MFVIEYDNEHDVVSYKNDEDKDDLDAIRMK